MRRAAVLVVLATLVACADTSDPLIGPPGPPQVDPPLVEGDVTVRIARGTCGIGRCGYTPSAFAVKRGALVVVRNLDDRARTWTARDDAFDSGPIEPGGTFRYRARTRGRFDVYDRTARYVTGLMVVR